jgi:hypothetical protein
MLSAFFLSFPFHYSLNSFGQKQSRMTAVTQEWLLGVAGAIIMILLGGNGYWISRLVNSIDLLRDKFEKVQLDAGHQEEKFQACQDRCDTHTDTVNQRLNDHSTTLKQHGEDIAVLKGSIKIKMRNAEG